MSLDVDGLIANLWPQLHAVSEADAVFVSETELTRLFADHLKRIAERFGCFVERDASFITLVSGTAVYRLPPRHLSTLHVALANKPLVASSRTELERRDTNYQTTPATTAKPVRRFYEDRHGFNQVGFHPVPAAADAGLHPEVIFHQYPCDLDEGIETPAVIGDLLELLVVADAYRKESDFQMVEVAQSCKSLAALYEQAMAEYWEMSQ